MAETKKDRKIEQRWTKALAARFTPVSDVFLENYSKLAPPIKPIEAMFIVHLLSFKWDRGHPFPSFGKVAGYMGISTAAVRGYARALESKGYLKRLAVVGSTTRFDLNPLFLALEKRLLKTFQEKARSIQDDGTAQSNDSSELMSFILDAMNKVGLKPAVASPPADSVKKDSDQEPKKAESSMAGKKGQA